MSELPKEMNNEEYQKMIEKLNQELKNNPNLGPMDEAWQFFHQSKVNVKNIIFLEAWKQGINKVGTEFFDIKADTVDAATDKLQLQPNFKFIKEAIGGYSHGKQVLLGLMYSFYNPEDGQKFLEQSNTANFVDALNVLDDEGRKIISQLWMNHSGW